MAKTEYTDEQREEALALHVKHGPAEAERRTGITPANSPPAKGSKGALCCLKRRLSDAVYRHLVDDLAAKNPGGQMRASIQSSATGLIPIASTSEQPLIGSGQEHTPPLQPLLDAEGNRYRASIRSRTGSKDEGGSSSGCSQPMGEFG